MISALPRVMAVFAHNEEKNIARCLDSIKQENNVETLKCFVLVNGCTDNTCKLVSEYSAANPFVELISIEVGDKANAWNLFIHNISPQAKIYFFLDGDCMIVPNSLNALEQCLNNNIFANAAAAIPLDVGRGTKEQIKDMIKNGGLSGNLYALSSSFVERIKDNNVFLPVGFIGDDSLVGALAYWDLEPGQEWDKTRIITCEYARFNYVSLSLFSLENLALYLRKKKRYSIRHIQNDLLRQSLKENGMKGIPRDINELYSRYYDHLKLKWRGLDTLFDWLALKSIKACLAKRSS